MPDSPYQAAWAFLQGCIETLTPLVPDLAATKLQSVLQDSAIRARQLAAADYVGPETEQPAEPLPAPSSGTSGGVYFPHDLESAGRGTFTAPGATEEEIEELMNRRFPDRGDGTDSA